MKIKCIKTSINDLNSHVINGNMKEYLLVGDTFWVYGIRFFKGITYVYIFNSSHLFEVPIELFDILENHISSEWKIKVWESGEVTFWPELFYKEEFLENFAERETEERSLFQTLQYNIER